MLKKHTSPKNLDELLHAEYGDTDNPLRQVFEAEAKAYYWREMLKSQREQAQLSQQQLADKINTHCDFIAAVEEGKSDIPLSVFLRILEGLGLELTLAPH